MEVVIYIRQKHRLMQRKTKILPLLSVSKPKSTHTKDKLKIQQLLHSNLQNRLSHKDYRFQDDFSTIKASNFISRIDTIDSPKLIFSICDQIKQLVQETNKQNIGAIRDELSPIAHRQTDPLGPKVSLNRQNQDNSKRIAQERHQAITLAKWMDDKLKAFRQRKTISFMDILQYKQNILNYALGKIIDSLTKKCREEGQILSLIWNNTFTMFQGVFNILIQATNDKEKQKSEEAKQLHQMFEVNSQFLKNQNQQLKKQNEQIFQKMKDVIMWNKRLRRERKQLKTQIRILQYRNSTYSQALQQTLDMLLQSTPEPAMVQTAKKIILKLKGQKNRKKHFFKQQVDSEVREAARDIVYKWLKNNSYTNEDKSHFYSENLVQQDKFILSEIEDINDVNRVNIYDYFKLFDVAVQASVSLSTTFAQCDHKLYSSTQVMTNSTLTQDQSSQTVAFYAGNNSNLDLQIMRSKQDYANKQQNGSRQLLKDKGKSLIKKSKEVLNAKGHKINEPQNLRLSAKNGYQQQLKTGKEEGRRASAITSAIEKRKFMQRSNKDSDSLREELQQTTTRWGQNQIIMIQEQKSVGDSDKADNTSMSDLLLQELRNTRHKLTTKINLSHNSNHPNDAADGSIQECSDMNNYANSTRVISTNKTIVRRTKHRKSLSYISSQAESKPVTRLKHKYFTESYPRQRQLMDSNNQQFFDQIVRRRSFFAVKRVEFANFKDAEDNTQRAKQYMRGGRILKNQKRHEEASNVVYQVDKLTKKASAPTNIAKTRTLTNAKGMFLTIASSVQQIPRFPPKNKTFVNNNLTTLTKYISSLILDYLKQFKKEKQDLIIECEKALYPLNILLMERMTFKYGLKDIADKKIKNFIQKILTFAPISEKMGLYSLLLGLEDEEVGSDELLVYIKCVVYFDFKKAMKDCIESTVIEVEVARENLTKILEYFFDRDYVNLLQLKLQIYFQQNASNITIQGISMLIIRELLKRKKDLKLKYLKVHKICCWGDNFFTNTYKMLKIVNNYRALAYMNMVDSKLHRQTPKQTIEAFKGMQSRAHKKIPKNEHKFTVDLNIIKIAEIIRQLLKRSDIMDEQHGKSLTPERFVTAAVICNVPNSQQVDIVLNYLKKYFEAIKQKNPSYAGINCEDSKSMDKLSKVWGKAAWGRSEDALNNLWSFAKLFSDKIEEQVNSVMGKVGSLGLIVETTLFNSGT